MRLVHVAEERFPWRRSHGEGWTRLGAEITCPGTKLLGSPCAANWARWNDYARQPYVTKQLSLLSLDTVRRVEMFAKQIDNE